MKNICFPLQHGQAIMLQGNYTGSAADISLLARLTCSELLENTEVVPEVVWHDIDCQLPSDAQLIYSGKTVRMVYQTADKSFRLYLMDDSKLHEKLYGIFLWQLSIICACTASLLRGNPVQLVHCSMLEKGDQALLLLGESGIGKSTSVKRWQQLGGTAVADDMVLLEYGKDDIYVHRLPTWSACRIKLEGRSYPFNPPLKLKNVLAISRSEEREQVKELSKAEYFAQLYRCGFFHYMFIADKLPLADKQALASGIKSFTDILTRSFKPQGFFANLNGNIQETLGEYL